MRPGTLGRSGVPRSRIGQNCGGVQGTSHANVGGVCIGKQYHFYGPPFFSFRRGRKASEVLLKIGGAGWVRHARRHAGGMADQGRADAAAEALFAELQARPRPVSPTLPTVEFRGAASKKQRKQSGQSQTDAACSLTATPPPFEQTSRGVSLAQLAAAPRQRKHLRGGVKQRQEGRRGKPRPAVFLPLPQPLP